jgi:hypothetical protein
VVAGGATAGLIGDAEAGPVRRRCLDGADEFDQG